MYSTVLYLIILYYLFQLKKKEFSLEVGAKQANIVLLSIGMDLTCSESNYIYLPLNIPKQTINIPLSLM